MTTLLSDCRQDDSDIKFSAELVASTSLIATCRLETCAFPHCPDCLLVEYQHLDCFQRLVPSQLALPSRLSSQQLLHPFPVNRFTTNSSFGTKTTARTNKHKRKTRLSLSCQAFFYVFGVRKIEITLSRWSQNYH